MSKNTQKDKVAVVLFNLGGPDNLGAVKPFLFNLFFDKKIIRLPLVLRYIVAKIISSKRENTAKEIYQKMGGKSTILDQTISQLNAIKTQLSKDDSRIYEVFISMRYWHPMSDETIKKIEEFAPTEVILVPLYPQFSSTTTSSSFEDFFKKIKKTSLKDIKQKAICCYHNEDFFSKAYASLIENEISKVKDKNNYRVLFSAHGLPRKIIEQGDPYQWQVESSVNAVIDNMSFEIDDYKITYQSRVGPLEWIGPSTDEEIEKAAKERKEIVIVPIAFVSEHSETLVELDIEYKAIADKYKVNYLRVPTLATDSTYINGLADLIIDFSKKEEEKFIKSANNSRICPTNFNDCMCK